MLLELQVVRMIQKAQLAESLLRSSRESSAPMSNALVLDLSEGNPRLPTCINACTCSLVALRSPMLSRACERITPAGNEDFGHERAYWHREQRGSEEVGEQPEGDTELPFSAPFRFFPDLIGNAGAEAIGAALEPKQSPLGKWFCGVKWEELHLRSERSGR